MRKLLVALALFVAAYFGSAGTGLAHVDAGMGGCHAWLESATTGAAGCDYIGGNVIAVRAWIRCTSAPTTTLYGGWVTSPIQTGFYTISAASCPSGYVSAYGYNTARLGALVA